MSTTKYHYSKPEIDRIAGIAIALKPTIDKDIEMLDSLNRAYWNTPIKGWIFTKTRIERESWVWGAGRMDFLRNVFGDFLKNTNLQLLVNSDYEELIRLLRTKSKPDGITVPRAVQVEIDRIFSIDEIYRKHGEEYFEYFLKMIDPVAGTFSMTK